MTLRSRRRLPLSTSTFDYSAYHSLDEVRKREIRGILGQKSRPGMARPGLAGGELGVTPLPPLSPRSMPS